MKKEKKEKKKEAAVAEAAAEPATATPATADTPATDDDDKAARTKEKRQHKKEKAQRRKLEREMKEAELKVRRAEGWPSSGCRAGGGGGGPRGMQEPQQSGRADARRDRLLSALRFYAAQRRLTALTLPELTTPPLLLQAKRPPKNKDKYNKEKRLKMKEQKKVQRAGRGLT